MQRFFEAHGWIFEVKQIIARRTECYGAEYDAQAILTIVDGELHIEGLLSKTGVGLTDHKALNVLSKELGFDNIEFKRFK